MAGHSLWNGIVRNTSDKWVLCLWDDEENGEKVWYGKALGPKRRSPNWLDIDGVIALDNGVTINNSLEWWWLDNGAEAKILNDASGLKLEITSKIGSTRKVSRAEVDDWHPKISRTQDTGWGNAL